LLGHLPHEAGHFYWQALVEDSDFVSEFRSLFGDEREDYRQALARHYEAGASPDWQTRYVSAYANAHPWEDWAETWAQYLHIVDTIDTAVAVGIELQETRSSFGHAWPSKKDDVGSVPSKIFLITPVSPPGRPLFRGEASARR
jgi:hypothetical protein